MAGQWAGVSSIIVTINLFDGVNEPRELFNLARPINIVFNRPSGERRANSKKIV
ncbi:hypothetical protein PPN31119_03238 [Pandoraea pnomenusa]|uniref:Uncharacterized protein n=1 Tax=Pandoraea pnomenusa TaxID=93220 RepID=A0ABY6WQK8_9BURK|nr:hypothetical protein PPN31119_03238 [Pandoraea pnomenusa]